MVPGEADFLINCPIIKLSLGGGSGRVVIPNLMFPEAKGRADFELSSGGCFCRPSGYGRIP
jgi:hypothetical protein